MVRLVWSEAGGPHVEAPTSSGFGSRLIERTVAADLGGKVTLDWRREGLRCELTFPWNGAGEDAADRD